jgi:exopolysaccharide biosynthesis protein
MAEENSSRVQWRVQQVQRVKGKHMKKIIKKPLFIVLAIFAAVLSILYYFADRYLIEHVQISNVEQYGQEVYSSEEEIKSLSLSSSEEKVDDWNYEGNGIKISISEVSQNNSDGPLVYYVADVVLSDAVQLKSAFAKNQFGTNIIEYTSKIASENNAVFAINGDYYGFRDDGIMIRNGVIYRDKPARTGLAIYKDGSMKTYDETKTSAEELLNEGVWNTLSFGPAILVDSQIPSGIESIEVDTNFGNHSIQGNQPRTGIGIIEPNHFVFIVADGRSKNYSVGVTLTEFAKIFKDLRCMQAYNLDGSGSSTMYFNGRVVNNPLGKNKERGVSDILYIG